MAKADAGRSTRTPANLLTPPIDDLDAFADELVALLTLLARRMRRLPPPSMCVE
jgi:hypothetical protein